MNEHRQRPHAATCPTRRQLTSESVTEGHPDKLADTISDTLVDAYLTVDRDAHVAIETLLAGRHLVVAGETRVRFGVDVRHAAIDVLEQAGYSDLAETHRRDDGYLTVHIGDQSDEIAHAVHRPAASALDRYSRQGAGDQGVVFGYATDETPALMPASITLAHQLAQHLDRARHSGLLEFLRPDGKTQVTVTYDEHGQPASIDTIVVSTQHDANVTAAELAHAIGLHVVGPVLDTCTLDSDHTRILVNPGGPFTLGGPYADTGVTGRKLAVDTYGAAARHGGGALSGKDPSKTDRSGAYAARWVAKNVVAAGLARRCEVQISYAIGQADPVSVQVDTHGTGIVCDDQLAAAVAAVFDLRPGAIIDQLNLRTITYRPLAVYGHFGRTPLALPWERTDRTGHLRHQLPHDLPYLQTGAGTTGSDLLAQQGIEPHHV